MAAASTKELVAAFGLDRRLVNEPGVGLVHERGGLQGVVAALVAEERLGERAQFVIDERQQIGRGGVSPSDAVPEPGCFLLFSSTPASPTQSGPLPCYWLLSRIGLQIRRCSGCPSVRARFARTRADGL